MSTAPIVLVPGFWLGAWAWDEVATLLRADGHDVTALTLPGRGSPDADRSAVTLADHVDAIAEAVRSAGAPVVLALHSGAGVSGYGASDLVAEHLAAVVYVDSGPATGAIDEEFSLAEMPLPSWDELTADGTSLDGLGPGHLEEFRARAVPEPGSSLREAPTLTHDARLDVPTTVICTSMTAEQLQGWVAQGSEIVGGLAELRDVTYVDLSTSHWPMWSRPQETAAIIGGLATAHAPRG